MQKNLIVVKEEESKENTTPARPRAIKGMGKEPVRQAARGEASDPPGDETMEDNEHIFGILRLLAATRCPISY